MERSLVLSGQPREVFGRSSPARFTAGQFTVALSGADISDALCAADESSRVACKSRSPGLSHVSFDFTDVLCRKLLLVRRLLQGSSRIREPFLTQSREDATPQGFSFFSLPYCVFATWRLCVKSLST